MKIILLFARPQLLEQVVALLESSGASASDGGDQGDDGDDDEAEAAITEAMTSGQASFNVLHHAVAQDTDQFADIQVRSRFAST